MKLRSLSGAVLALAFAAAPVRAADDSALLRMATCQDSWLDWNKAAPASLKAFGERFQSQFSHSGNDPFATPKAPVSVAGLRIVQAFPQSVGMGVGFSLTVAASFDKARKVVETTLGKKLIHCEASDGMHSCELEIAAQRTVTLMSADDAPNETLIGCYYLYEK